MAPPSSRRSKTCPSTVRVTVRLLASSPSTPPLMVALMVGELRSKVKPRAAEAVSLPARSRQVALDHLHLETAVRVQDQGAAGEGVGRDRRGHDPLHVGRQDRPPGGQ